jgi:regulator of RNase E activity RraA
MMSPSDPTTRICGPAYTVKMVLGSDDAAPKLDKHFVDEATPNSIIVIDAPSRSFSSSAHFLYRRPDLRSRSKISSLGRPYG